MTSINLHIPDDLKAKLERRAAEHGHTSVESYIEALVQEDSEWQDRGGPAGVSFDSRSEFEAKLVDGLNSSVCPASDSDWERLKDQLVNRHAGKRTA